VPSRQLKAVLVYKPYYTNVNEPKPRYIKIEDIKSWIPEYVGRRLFYVLHAREPLTRADLEAWGLVPNFDRYAPQYKVCREDRSDCRYVSPILLRKEAEVEVQKGVFSKREVTKARWIAELVNEAPEGLPKVECAQPPQGRRICAVRLDGAERVYVEGEWLGLVIRAAGSLEEEMGRVVHVLVRGGEWLLQERQFGYAWYAYTLF